jgi:hypothetical protein
VTDVASENSIHEIVVKILCLLLLFGLLALPALARGKRASATAGYTLFDNAAATRAANKAEGVGVTRLNRCRSLAGDLHRKHAGKAVF